MKRNKKFNGSGDLSSNNFALYKLFPSFITILALCCGLTAIKFAFMEQWQKATTLVIMAAFLDNLDGKMARLLDATSKFGIELDSLCDFVSFGIVPPTIMYFWSMHNAKGFGWGVVLFASVCAVCRLARFNVAAISASNSSKDKQIQNLQSKFFTGVPTPSAAILMILPLIITFEFPEAELYFTPYSLVCYVACIGVLMISRVPTISLKRLNVKREFAPFVIVAVALFFVMLFTELWKTTIAISIIYLLSIPYTIYKYLSCFSKINDNEVNN